jgi:hypothetical protein
MPPEMVGFTTALRLLWPIVVSALGTSTVLLPRAALSLGGSATGAAVRAALGCLLLSALVAYWVKVRDRVRLKIRRFMEEGQQQARQRSSA